MPDSSRGARSRSYPRDDERYSNLCRRPLYILVFLAPLIALYEIGSFLFFRGQGGEGSLQTIRAHRLLNQFFDAFGAGAFYLPGVALVVVLLIWHMLRRDRWKVQWSALGMMLVESLAWAAPLLVFGLMIGRALSEPASMAQAATPAAALAQAPWMERVTIAIGAGLYEELLFRLVGITLLHLILVDLIRIKNGWGNTLAIIGAALAFALYHDSSGATTAAQMGIFAFYFTSGLYFGAIFVSRGFGIVVAVHTIYDLLVLLLQ